MGEEEFSRAHHWGRESGSEKEQRRTPSEILLRPF
jgi:hypothetical protein